MQYINKSEINQRVQTCITLWQTHKNFWDIDENRQRFLRLSAQNRDAILNNIYHLISRTNYTRHNIQIYNTELYADYPQLSKFSALNSLCERFYLAGKFWEFAPGRWPNWGRTSEKNSLLNNCWTEVALWYLHGKPESVPIHRYRI